MLGITLQDAELHPLIMRLARHGGGRAAIGAGLRVIAPGEEPIGVLHVGRPKADHASAARSSATDMRRALSLLLPLARLSCFFSNVGSPRTSIFAPIASARSPRRYAASVGMTISPPFMLSAVERTRSTASSMVMKNRVQSGSVTGTM